MEAQPRKHRKNMWTMEEHFPFVNVGDGCIGARCKQCKRTCAFLTGSEVEATSELRKHLAKGICGFLAARHEIARMIIIHGFTLHLVEDLGFVSFVRILQPKFEMVSLNTVEEVCVAVFLREKQSVLNTIKAIPGKTSLSLDLWTSTQSVGYVLLTSHFIDNDWKLQRWILNVVMEPYPDSKEAFRRALAVCLSEWMLENKLFSITLNRRSGEVESGNLRAHLFIKDPLMLDGQFLSLNCLAHTLSCMAQDVMNAGEEVIRKVRESVKYVMTVDFCEEKFLELKQVPLDNQMQWNTTCEMLVAACKLKEVFSSLNTLVPDYWNAPTMDVWEAVEKLCGFLKPLFDLAVILASANPTTSFFFWEVWKIRSKLAEAVVGSDGFVTSFAKPMLEKLDEYWKDCNRILAITAVMDPRFKMKLVEFIFKQYYGKDATANITNIKEGIKKLFLKYVVLEVDESAEEADSEDCSPSNDLAGFSVYAGETVRQPTKLELDQYLNETVWPVSEF